MMIKGTVIFQKLGKQRLKKERCSCHRLQEHKFQNDENLWQSFHVHFGSTPGTRYGGQPGHPVLESEKICVKRSIYVNGSQLPFSITMKQSLVKT